VVPNHGLLLVFIILTLGGYYDLPRRFHQGVLPSGSVGLRSGLINKFFLVGERGFCRLLLDLESSNSYCNQRELKNSGSVSFKVYLLVLGNYNEVCLAADH